MTKFKFEGQTAGFLKCFLIVDNWIKKHVTTIEKDLYEQLY